MTTETPNLCPITGKPLPVGYYLHPSVSVQIRKTARRVPGLYDDALRRVGGGAKISEMPSHGMHKDGILWPMLADLQAAENRVKGAALLGGMPLSDPCVKDAATWLTNNADQAARSQEAEKAYTLLRDAVKALTVMADRQAGRRLVICPDCGHKSYVTVGRLQTLCGECGIQVDVEDSNADLREQGLYTYMRKDLALEYVHMVTGITVSARQLKYMREKNLVTYAGEGRHAHYQPIQIIEALQNQKR